MLIKPIKLIKQGQQTQERQAEVLESILLVGWDQVPCTAATILKSITQKALQLVSGA
jgi:hypothetical protein